MEEKKAIDQKVKNASITVIVGSALLIIGLFLPWISVGFDSVTGFEKIQDAVIFLVLAAAFGLAGFMGLSSKKNYGILIALCSLGCLLFLEVISIRLMDMADGSVQIQIAYGFYISGGGAFIGLVGGAMLAQSRGKKQPGDQKKEEVLLQQ